MHEPELLPARMINEFVYCPRLFWLEHVEGVFVDNEHTVRGQHEHRAVDRPGGVLPAPDAEERRSEPESELAASDPSESTNRAETWHTRALALADTELGVIATLDYVEDLGESVMPVDTKKGRSNGGTLWPSDRVQLAVQGLLLRSRGFTCDRIAAFYVEERRRVIESLDTAAEESARLAVASARECARGKIAPPPLQDSPKCPGCSLNVVCLPDETNHLQAPESGPVRRVVPPHDEKLPLYVTAPNATIRLSGSCLHVQVPGAEPETLEVGLAQTAHVSIFGTAKLTTQALRACLERGIPVAFFSTGGWLYGVAEGDDNRQVHVRVAQFRNAPEARGLSIARRLVSDKVSNQRTLVRRNADGSDAELLRRLKHTARRALSAESRDELLGLEGSAAREYWSAYANLFPAEWRPTGRSRRPPEDPVNAMLSFAYALLVKDCRLAVRFAGLDPYFGVFHTAHHGRPSLALDLMEPFRPLVVDSVVLLAVRRGEVRLRDFVKTGQAVAMNTRARRVLVRSYERRMDELLTHPTFGYRISYRQTIAVQARLLARALMSEIDDLPALRTR